MPQDEAGKQDAKWSLLFWGGAGVAAFIYGLWCVYDGWFSGHEQADLNKIMAPISFAVSGWLIWQGIKESRQIRGQAQQPTPPEEEKQQ